MVIGRATRLAQFFTHNDKVYEGVIHFGYSTDSYDMDGTPTSPEIPVALKQDAVETLFNGFRGELMQTPPPVSAKKIDGRPAYERARKNLPVDLKPVPVTVYALEVIAMAGCEVTVRIHCGAGTYVRSIAHDAGQAMGCGAFLKALRRLGSGDFRIEQSRTLEELAALATANHLSDALLPAAGLLPQFPVEIVDIATLTHIRNGRDFRVSPFQVRGEPRYVKAVTQDGQLAAIGEAVLPHLYHPVLVL
jgi:tRNA pseudouridine55 synthase